MYVYMVKKNNKYHLGNAANVEQLVHEAQALSLPLLWRQFVLYMEWGPPIESKTKCVPTPLFTV